MKEKKLKAKALLTELEVLAEDFGTDVMGLIHEMNENEGGEYSESSDCKPSNKFENELQSKKAVVLAKAKKYGA